MAATFVAEDGTLKGLVLSLDEGSEWTIGRDPEESSLLIEDPLASRKHLFCRSSPEGIIAENLSQTNPVLLNNEEFSEPRLLKNGDRLKIGSCIYRFKDGNPTEIEDEPSRDTIFEEDDHRSSFAEINFGMVNTGRWLLKVINGPNNGAEFSMHSNSTHIVGTDPNTADIVFHDTSVSRQHLRISVSADNIITIEDLQSRNGTLVDGEQIKEKRILPLNTTVTLGTTTFVIYDREAEMKTIISPLLPSILKVLQQDENKKAEAAAEEVKIHEPIIERAPAEHHTQKHTSGLIMIGIITGLFVIAGIGVSSLFRNQEIEVTQNVNADQELSQALSLFPTIKPFFTSSTGKLYLVGHLLNAGEKNQLIYNLQGLKFVKDIDDTGVVVDEYVWQEANQIINKNPNWKGINIYASAPGKFILTGYLQTRKQAEQLSDYITANFNYLDLLEKRVIVEEDIVSSVSSILQSMGFRDIVAQLTNGELTLTGVIAKGKQQDFDSVLNEIKKVPGIRNVKNFVTEVAPEATMINITDKYEVTGYSRTGAGSVNVVINGKILSKGDSLDGMFITEIRPNAVLLEKDNVQYRIDFNR